MAILKKRRFLKAMFLRVEIELGLGFVFLSAKMGTVPKMRPLR